MAIEGVDNPEWKDSMSKWYKRLNAEEQGHLDRLVYNLQNPISRIPEGYAEAAQRYNEQLKKENIAGELMQEQLYEIDTTFAQTYYDSNVTSQILAPITEVMSVPRWQSKMYTVSGDEYPNFVEKTFDNIAWFKLGVEPSYEGALGQIIGYHLPWTLMREDKEGLYDLLSWHALKAGVMMGKNWEERYWYGSAGLHTTSDIGATGLMNEGDLTQLFGGGAGDDNNFTAALDIDYTIKRFLGQLRTVNEPGDIIIVSTAGVAEELLSHDQATTGLTELEVIWKKYFATGAVQEWWICNELAQEALATNKQAFIMFKRSKQTMAREIIYPLQSMPVMNKTFAEDAKEVMLQADICKWRVTEAAVPAIHTTVVVDCTTTNVGFFKNGLFLSGTGSVHPFKLPSIYSSYTTQ